MFSTVLLSLPDGWITGASRADIGSNDSFNMRNFTELWKFTSTRLNWLKLFDHSVLENNESVLLSRSKSNQDSKQNAQDRTCSWQLFVTLTITILLLVKLRDNATTQMNDESEACDIVDGEMARATKGSQTKLDFKFDVTNF